MTSKIQHLQVGCLQHLPCARTHDAQAQTSSTLARKESLHLIRNDVQGVSMQLEQQLGQHSRSSSLFCTFGGTVAVEEGWKVTFHGVTAKKVIKLLCFLNWTHFCDKLVKWMKWKVSPIQDTPTSFSTTLKEPLESGISDKATKTCHLHTDTCLIQLSADFLVCQYCRRSSGKLAFNSKIQPCGIFHLDMLPKSDTKLPLQVFMQQLNSFVRDCIFFHTPVKTVFSFIWILWNEKAFD